MKKFLLVATLCIDALIGMLYFLGIQHSLFILYSYWPLLALNLLVVLFCTRSRWKYLAEVILAVGMVLYAPYFLGSNQIGSFVAQKAPDMFKVVTYQAPEQAANQVDYQVFEGSQLTLGFCRVSQKGRQEIKNTKQVELQETLNQLVP